MALLPIIPAPKCLEQHHKMMNTLSEFYEQKILTDVTIVVADHRYSCHRNVLAAGSSYFRLDNQGYPAYPSYMTKYL